MLEIICAILSRLQGWDSNTRNWNPIIKSMTNHLTSKYAVAVYFGLIVFALGHGWLGAYIAVAWGLASSMGWGDYWDGSERKNDEIAIIDNFVGNYLRSGYWNDYASMSLRLCMYAPFFIFSPVHFLAFVAILPPLYLAANSVGGHLREALKNPEHGHIIVELVRGVIVGAYLGAL